MTDLTERRHPPSKPPRLGPPPKPQKIDAAALEILWRYLGTLGRELERLWSHVGHAYNSLPAPHANTHSAGGSDALDAGASEDAEMLAWLAWLRHDEGHL